MVYRTLRKRRSKRSMKRSIKHYRRHANTRIRRNIYRKKHKKTQRGGEFRFSNLLPGRLKFSRVSGLKLPPSIQTYRSMNGNQELSYYIGHVKIDIPVSGNNTLNGKRYLKGNIKIFNEETGNFTDDGGILYFLINSVVEKTPNIYVSVRQILFNNREIVELSNNDINITIEKLDVNSDTSSYKIKSGLLPNNVDGKLQSVFSLTSVDLEDIPNPYKAPFTY